MPVSEPGWWYAETGGGLPARMLAPVARVWSWAALRRLGRGPAYRPSLPVICVGNFTAGGTGKTPLAIHIARRLAGKGERPVFLTRGYGGRIRGPHTVNPALDSAADVGDEPLLLARHAPAIVARDRVAGARLAEAFAGIAPPTVIVMDDGLQNPGLGKDLAIAIVDGRRGLGNGRVIPSGPLRAPLEAQLALADAVLVMRPRGGADADGAVLADMRACFPGPVLEASVVPDATQADGLAGRRVVALAGIANPARFFMLLDEIGAVVVDRARFNDHHAFTEREARDVMDKARRLDAAIVTTEKDWVRLSGSTGALAELRDQALQLPIRLQLEERDDARLASLIEAALLRRNKPASGN